MPPRVHKPRLGLPVPMARPSLRYYSKLTYDVDINTVPRKPGISRQKHENGIDPVPFVRKSMTLRQLMDLHKERRRVAFTPKHDFYEVLVHFAFPHKKDKVFAYIIIWRWRDRLSNEQIRKILNIEKRECNGYIRKATRIFLSFVNRHAIDQKILEKQVPATLREEIYEAITSD